MWDMLNNKIILTINYSANKIETCVQTNINKRDRKVSFTAGFLQINPEGLVKGGNYPLASTTIIIIPGKNHQCMLPLENKSVTNFCFEGLKISSHKLVAQ